VGDDQQAQRARVAKNDEAFLSLRVVWIVDDERTRVKEDGASLVERDTMLGSVQRVLVRVPLKPQLIHTYIVVVGVG